MEEARQHSSVRWAPAVEMSLKPSISPGISFVSWLFGGHKLAHCDTLVRNLSHSGHNSGKNRQKSTVAPRKYVVYTIRQLLDYAFLLATSGRKTSSGVKPCVTIGERKFLGRRAYNTVLRERRRQTCPPQSKPFWPLAFSRLSLLALSKKKLSSLSRSWKKSPWASSDLSEPSGARLRTRQPLACPTGERPC